MRNASRLFFLLLGMVIFVSVASQGVASVDPDFKPVCVGAVLTSKELRPGDQTALTLHFRNDGTAPARTDYTVFVHLEHPDKSCHNIVVGADHPPTTPMTAWEPGMIVTDGAHLLTVPANAPEGVYYLHVGVYSREGSGHPRLSDQYVAEVTVSRGAAASDTIPPPMTRQEITKRKLAARKFVGPVLGILTDQISQFRIAANGSWQLLDRRSGEVWMSDPERPGLCDVTYSNGDRTITRRVGALSLQSKTQSSLSLVYRPGGDLPNVRFSFALVAGNGGIRFSYSGDVLKKADAEWKVASIRLLDNALWATDTERGYLVIPHRLGMLFPASEGLPCVNRYTAYANNRAYSMSMLGAVKNGSAVLVCWDNPYTHIEARRSQPDLPNVPGHGMVSVSLILSKDATSVVVKPLGKGGYAQIASSYRDVALRRGLLRTWKQKMKENPNAEAMLGAADFKPFVFSRVAPNTRWNQTNEERVTVAYSFDEAAKVAEHLKKEVGIDRAMFVLAGWIHRGYDNQHPDILPAAPECGGNEALAACARRVRNIGYLFGLHDNYQDMYRDAPSWDESYLMKNRDGSPRHGGVWAGGQAYLTCSKKALELARRPQNLPKVKELFGPTVYFIDTTFAAPLQECFDPRHPLDFAEDMRWKRSLCEYARRMFGLFGSEEGQEWAVPCADYFEGMMSHRTQRSKNDIVIPLFEMIYGDCVNLYSHQGDRATYDRAECILNHILHAEMPVYQFGPHLYFEKDVEAPKPSADQPATTCFSWYDGSDGLGRTDRFIKTTYEILSPLNRITAHTPMTKHEFLTDDRSVEQSEFGDVKITVNYGSSTYSGGRITLPQYGFVVQSPGFVAFYANVFGENKFTKPTMAVVRSLDGQPLHKSKKLHTYLAFGDEKVTIAGRSIQLAAKSRH